MLQTFFKRHVFLSVLFDTRDAQPFGIYSSLESLGENATTLKWVIDMHCVNPDIL